MDCTNPGLLCEAPGATKPEHASSTLCTLELQEAFHPTKPVTCRFLQPSSWAGNPFLASVFLAGTVRRGRGTAVTGRTFSQLGVMKWILELDGGR